MHVNNHPRGVIAPRGCPCLGFLLALDGERRDVRLYRGIGPVLLQKSPDPLPRIPKQRPVDEIDGRGGALDVQQDDADPLQVDRARTGM